MTKTPTDSQSTGRRTGSEPVSVLRDVLGQITRLEITVGAVIALVMVALVVIEPDILEAPFENERTLLFTFGGTVMAALAFVAMLRLGVPPVVRVIVLVVPFILVNWWLISPYFTDEVVEEEFATSISQQLDSADEASATPEVEGDSDPDPAPAVTEASPTTVAEPDREESSPTEVEAPTAPSTPVLLGVGQFVGLAGHSGTGDAGIFQNPDGTLVIRFENFDIENGPDLEVYLVPGADQTSLPDGSIHLGALKGNVGDQNYELPAGTELGSGPYTVLVWCEAFSVEFVGATIDL